MQQQQQQQQQDKQRVVSSSGLHVALATAQTFSISAAASAVGATAVYPIDLVKTRMQNQRVRLAVGSTTSASSSVAQAASSSSTGAAVIHRNSWQCFLHVLRHEGPMKLYKGLAPNLLGQVPEKAIRLFVVEQVRQLCRDVNENGLQLVPEIAAGVAAGTCQVIITNPMEIVKVRLQVAGQIGAAATQQQQQGIVSMLRELGLRGMYRGASACFLRDMPFSGLYFPIYAYFKHTLSQRHEEPGPKAIDLLVSGTIAGCFASGLTTPADVIKTRLQVKPAPGELPYKGLVDCTTRVLKNEGFRALFKGVGPRIARSAPQYGVMLLAFEVLQKFVKGEGGTVEPPQMGGAAVPMVVEDRWRFMQQWVPPAKFIEGAKELQRIAVGGQGNVWGIGKSGGIFKWTGFEWRKVGGELDYISVGADGAACGVRNGVLYHWDPWDMQFKQMPSAQVMAKVSVGNQSCIWAITPEGEAFKYAGGNRWKPRSGVQFKHISVGSDGTVWGIERGNSGVYRWSSKENKWIRVPGEMRLVSVGSRESVWGVGARNDRLYRWDPIEQKWLKSANVEHMLKAGSDRPLANLSVAADGTVIGAAGDAAPVIVQDPLRRLPRELPEADADLEPPPAGSDGPAPQQAQQQQQQQQQQSQQQQSQQQQATTAS